MADFRTIKYQGSIFTPDLVLSNYFKLTTIILELLGDKLQANPVMLPIPQDAPADIPRIQLCSLDNKWNLNLSLARTDLIFLEPSVESEIEVTEIEFCEICNNFFSSYRDRLELRVQRLAFVTERLSPQDHASTYIINKFCKRSLTKKGKPFHDINKFEIHSMKTYDWENYHLNSWVRIKSLEFNEDNKVVPILFIQNDLNTLSLEKDQERDFSREEIGNFFQKIPSHLQHILRIYDFDFNN